MSGAIATEPEDKPTKKLPVPAPRSRTSLSSPTSIGEESLVEGNDETKSSSSLSEYSKCSFRFDINVTSDRQEPSPNVGDYEILMELTTKDGKKRVLQMDTQMLTFLHSQLEKVEQAFPRCYVYKTDQ